MIIFVDRHIALLMNEAIEFPLRPEAEPYKSLEVKRLNIKSVSLCHTDSLALLVTYDELAILDT